MCARPQLARTVASKLCTPRERRVIPTAFSALSLALSKVPGSISKVISQSPVSPMLLGTIH